MEILDALTLPLPETWLVRPETTFLLLGAGAVLLLFGRRLFWLFVAVVGAVAALWLSTEVLGLEAGAPSVLAAIAAGLVGGLLAVLLQKAAVALVGFLAGAWGILALLQVVTITLSFWTTAGSDLGATLDSPLWQGVLALVGGLLGAILMAQLFEAALVVLTATAGSLLLVQGLGLAGKLALAVFAALAVIGVLTQTRTPRERREPARGRRGRRRRRQEDPV